MSVSDGSTFELEPAMLDIKWMMQKTSSHMQQHHQHARTAPRSTTHTLP